MMLLIEQSLYLVELTNLMLMELSLYLVEFTNVVGGAVSVSGRVY
jgi:hypothetical protein